MRAGQGRIQGEHGSCLKLTLDVYSIVKSLFYDKPWTLLASPLAVLVPAFTLNHWIHEIRFCQKWTAQLKSGERRRRMLWDMDSSFEANWAS